MLVVLLIIFLQNPRELIALINDLLATPGVRVPVILGLLAVLALFCLYLYFQIRRWKRTQIIIDGTNLIVHQSTLMHKDYVIAMQNISSLNQEQKLIQKILGVHTIRIDTNTTATAEEADVSIMLDRRTADEFRSIIESRMHSLDNVRDMYTAKSLTTSPDTDYDYARFSNDAIDDDSWDVTYTPKETIMHSILSTGILGLMLAVAAIGFSYILSDEMELSANGLMDLLISAIIIIVALWAVIGGAIKKYLLYCNFKAKRKGNYILLSYGLTTTRKFRIPVDKINTVYVVQSDLGRILRMQEVHISAIGMGDADNEIKNVLLYGKKARIRENLELLLPEFIPYYDGRLERKDMRARVIDTVKVIMIFVILIVLAMLFVPLEIIPMSIGSVIAIGLAVFAVTMGNVTAGLYVGESGIKVRNGIFGAKETLVGYNKIQTVNYVAGPIFRRLGLAKGTMTLFGGMLDLVVSTEAFREEEFCRIAERTVETDCFK